MPIIGVTLVIVTFLIFIFSLMFFIEKSNVHGSICILIAIILILFQISLNNRLSTSITNTKNLTVQTSTEGIDFVIYNDEFINLNSFLKKDIQEGNNVLVKDTYYYNIYNVYHSKKITEVNNTKNVEN